MGSKTWPIEKILFLTRDDNGRQIYIEVEWDTAVERMSESLGAERYWLRDERTTGLVSAALRSAAEAKP